MCVLVHLEIRQWRSIDRVPRAQRLRCCTIIQAISNSQERVDRLAAAVPSTLAVDVDNGGRLTQCGTESGESTLVLSTIHMRSYAPVEERDATKSVVGIVDDCPLRQLLLPNVEAPHAVQHVCDPTPSQPRLAETVVAPAPRAAVLGAACSCPPYCAAPSGGASPHDRSRGLAVLVFEPDPSWPEELDLVRERAGRAVSASLGLDLTAVVRHDWQHDAKLRHDTIGNTTPKYDYNDLLAPARNSMVLLEECEPLVFVVALAPMRR